MTQLNIENTKLLVKLFKQNPVHIFKDNESQITKYTNCYFDVLIKTNGNIVVVDKRLTIPKVYISLKTACLAYAL